MNILHLSFITIFYTCSFYNSSQFSICNTIVIFVKPHTKSLARALSSLARLQIYICLLIIYIRIVWVIRIIRVIFVIRFIVIAIFQDGLHIE